MIVLALLLLLLAIAIVVFVLIAGVDQQVQLTSSLLNLDWRPSVLVVFLLGALSLFLAEIALAMMRAGTRRKVEQRRELKRLREVERERTLAERHDQHDSNDRHDKHDKHDESRDVVDVRDEHQSTRTMPVAPGDGMDRHEARSTAGSKDTWHDDPADGRRTS